MQTMLDLFKAAGYEDYASLEPYKFYTPKAKILISSYDLTTKKAVEKQVTGVVYKGMAKDGYVVTSSRGSFLATGEHLVYNAGLGTYQALKNVYASKDPNKDCVFQTLTDDEHLVGTAYVSKVTESFPVLDIEVEGTQCYFSGGMLSHNTFGGSARLTSDALKRINLLLNKFDTSLIWISQERASMSMYGSPFSACVTPDTIINIEGMGDVDLGTFIQESLGLADLEKLAVDYFYDLDREFLIQSFDHVKNKVVFKRVLSVVRKGEDFVYLVKDSKGLVILECAGAHGIFDAKSGVYCPVADITKAVAFGLDGKEEPVTIVRTSTKAPIYDLQVEDTECYFSNGILSHNTGGNAVKYFASIRNRITKIDVIKDGKDEVGIQIKVRNLKNKTSVPWREAIMNLYFDGGFDTESEYVDFLAQLGVIQQRGAYFYLPGQEKGIQGKEKLIEWLKENPAKYDVWKQEILERLSGKLESDATNTNPETEELPTRGTTEADVQSLASQALGVEETPPELELEGD